MSYKVVSECFSRRVFIVKPQQFLRNGSCVCNYSTSVQDAKPFKSIPGLSSLPYIGPIHHFLPVIGQYGPKGTLFNIIGDLHKQFGPIVRLNGVFGRADTVMLFDPVDIDQVYRSQESNPLRSGFETLEYYREHVRKDKFDGFQGLITSHGAQWRELRSKVNPVLLKLKLVQLYTPPLDEIVQEFVDRLKRLMDDETYLRDKLDVELEKWALESLGVVGLGARLGCLNDKMSPEAQQLIECSKFIIHKAFQLDFFPNPWRYIATPSYKKLMKAYQKQWELSEMYIRQARKRIDERDHDIPEEEKSIIEKLLGIDERVAIVMANEMLLAGMDTVTFVVLGVLYNLASNPEKQERLRQELKSDDNQKRYLKACLKETLRIRSVLPSNLRRTDKDHIVRGYHIPAGIEVVVPNEYLSNLEEFYPQPNKFIPERWLADKTDPLYYGNAHPMVTLPFGFGIRSCIGRRLAELEIELMVKKLIEQFKVTWEGPPIKSANKFANHYEKPYNFRFEAIVYHSSSYNHSTSIKNAKPFKTIPGLSSLPYLGPLHHFLPLIGEFGLNINLFDLANILYERYGPVVKINGIMGRADMVILFDPKDLYQVFRSQEHNPIRPAFETMDYYRDVLKKDTFDGIYGLTSAQGAKWRDFRKKVNPALLNLKLARVYATPLEEIAQDFINRLKYLTDDKKYLTENFVPEISKWSLESVAFVGLGTRLESLKQNLTPKHPASILTQCAKDIGLLSIQLEFLPNPWKYIATSAYKKLIKAYDTQLELCTMYIEKAKSEINKRGFDIPEEDKSIVEKLIAIDERVAIMMAVEMLLAGVDTVSFTVAGLIYHLANNPDKQERLREEIRSDNPHKRYLRACVKEALRIWHVIPPNLRKTDRDHVVGGYHIPPGIVIIAPNEFLSRLEKYYPRPNEFIPERWLADKTDPLYYGNAHPMVTLPFGFGIRSCVGRRLAELEIEILMKKLIDEFKVTWEGPPILNINMSTFVSLPYNAKFVVAK